MRVMIDTNVIIDVYQNREAFVENSAAVLKLSESKKITGIITANTVTDIFYILGRSIKDSELLRQLVQKLLTTVTLADVTAKDVTGAFDIPMSDYEDALLAQCAQRLKADYIVTRNMEDFKTSPVKAMMPDVFLNSFFP